MMETETAGYEGWAIVELMGHRRLAGKVSEASQYGTAMLRVDIPNESSEGFQTQFYGGSSIYCLTPTTEQIARSVANGTRPSPVHAWELPKLPASPPPPGVRPSERYCGTATGDCDCEDD